MTSRVMNHLPGDIFQRSLDTIVEGAVHCFGEIILSVNTKARVKPHLSLLTLSTWSLFHGPILLSIQANLCGAISDTDI